MIRKPTILVAVGLLCFLTLCSAPRVFAAPQDPPQTEGDTTSRPETSTGIPTRNDVVVVTGTFVPGPLSENNRSVTSLDPREQPLLFGSTVDYLRLEPSVDLRQRGIYGVQSDLSIRGSTFGQSLVLLNGMRLNDAQTGHHNMDLPIPLESVSRIEVLRGAGSTFHGADALGGAVNFITGPPEASELRLRTGVGNFGFNQQRVLASLLKGRWSETLSASRDFSTGFRPGRDFRSTSLSSESRFQSALGATSLLFAGSDRPFGADQFYGNFNSWERTKSWFASLSQELGEKTRIAASYHRHSDLFRLFRTQPTVSVNNHISQTWQAVIRRRDALTSNSTLSYGADAQGDTIDSSNLGHHARNRGAGYLNLDLRALRRFSLSVGAREEIFSGGRSEFNPSIAGGVWLRPSIKLRASVSRAFRLPTYTDLYYQDPATAGNPNLKPESAWSFEAGADWNPTPRLSAGVTVFHRNDENVIDYVQSFPGQKFQATNIQNLQFTGAETFLRLRLPHYQQVDAAYTALHGNKDGLPGLVSRYVFNYPTHNAMFGWTGSWSKLLTARARAGITQRFLQSTYLLMDFSAARNSGVVRPFLQLSNLSNTTYREIPGVIMPGRGIVGGIELVIAKDHH